MSTTRIKALVFLLSLCTSASSLAAEPNYDDLIQQSLLQRNNGDFLQAEATLRLAMPLARETNEVTFLLAMVIAFQERFIESIRILDTALQTYPNDTQLILGKARVLSYQGFYRESIDIADQALVLDPTNIEALALKARVYYYQRRYTDARAQFNAVLALDSSNLEALIGLYDVEMAAGNRQEANLVLDRAESIAPAHIDVTTRREQGTVLANSSTQILTASYGRSNLDLPGFQDWQSRNLEYRYISNTNNQVYIRSENAHRFGLHDTLLEIGGIVSGASSSLELSIAHTPDGDILPQQRFRLGGNFLLMQATENFGGTTLGVSFTQSRFANAKVKWLQADFTHYLLNYNAWLTPGISIVEDETGQKTTGWNIGAHWQTSARLLVGYNYTDAPETELNVTTQTNAHHLYSRVDLTDATNLRLDLSRNTRENSYTRDTIVFSIQHEF